MFYLFFAVFSLGAALLQSSYLRAPKGVVPRRRRLTYTTIAVVATSVQVLVGAFMVPPTYFGSLIFIPIFYLVNRGVQAISLRLRYTFRIGLALVLLSGYPLVHLTWKALDL